MTCRNRRTRTYSKIRFLSAGFDQLEVRQLLSTVVGPVSTSGIFLNPLYQIKPSASPADASPPAGAFTPSQIAKAYGFNNIQFGSVKGDGTGETIAIVDAYDVPTVQADLNTFDTQFNLPATTLTVVNETGGSTLPTPDPADSWETETSLDVQWAHAMAPGAKILLVETNSNSFGDLFAGVSYASAHANVVSMSFGSTEFAGETSFDPDLVQSGVVFVAGSGDDGAPNLFPTASPNVLSVGGTSLFLTKANAYSSESGWDGSGGGPSPYYSQPSYQKGVVTQTTTQRATPDVSYDADPYTGYAVYNSYAPTGYTAPGWFTVGGTSAGTPQWAALIAIADQGRALSSLPALDATNPQEVQTILYDNPAAFHDIVAGGSVSDSGGPNYNAKVGYDYVTGLGSPYADRVTNVLLGLSTNPNVEHLGISAPSTAAAGFSFQVTVTAYSSGTTVDSSFLGTVQLTSFDPIASLPSNYTFTAADHGVHTFTVTLKTSGYESITATDTTATALPVTSTSILVAPAAASSLTVTTVASPVTAGVYRGLAVVAMDQYGNIATSFTGKIQLSSSDPRVVFSPSSTYTLTAADAGVYDFYLQFNTAGVQSLKLTSNTGFTVTQSGISVVPAVPAGLKATPGSGSVVLTWNASDGASQYVVQRSLDGTTWTQIGLAAADTATYTDKTVLPGTNYYYRVQAAGGAGSAFSATVSVTTTGVTLAAATSLWSNSYTPTENSYASGAYEVGTKFTSSVAGVVTGLRFYKEAFMGGYTHVGHLWSSTGTLLASVVFTSETYSGWQQVNFSNAVAISANTTYIISFSSGGGSFGITTSYFSNGGVTSGPLEALPNSTAGGNGVYGKGSGVFPTVSAAGMNFWVDLTFSATTVQSSVSKPSTSSSPLVNVATTPLPVVTAGGTTSKAAAASPAATTLATPSPSRQLVNQAPVAPVVSTSKLI